MFNQKNETAALIRRFCLSQDLSTSDPYDIWKTTLGHWLKRQFCFRKTLTIPFAGMMVLWDYYFNNSLRLGYQKQEFPIVRAMAAQSLLNLYAIEKKTELLETAKNHINWLLCNHSTGVCGLGWGLNFAHQVDRQIHHEVNTPFSTMTLYCLEAIVKLLEFCRPEEKEKYVDALRQGALFFLKDIQIVYEDQEQLCTSYTASKDRAVFNAASYAMCSYELLQPYVNDDDRMEMKRRSKKILRFLLENQREDGSWFYTYNDSHSFIDCFHSCIVLKNMVKTNALSPSSEITPAVMRGYNYLKDNMLDQSTGLFHRFSKSNKPNIVRFDLYDNAEVLNLAIMLYDDEFATRLYQAIRKKFFQGNDNIYSVIDYFGFRYNKNFLRWAVVPLICALSSSLTREDNVINMS